MSVRRLEVKRVLPFAGIFLLSTTSLDAQRSHLILVPRDKPTIQAAIDAARVGDTIVQLGYWTLTSYLICKISV